VRCTRRAQGAADEQARPQAAARRAAFPAVAAAGQRWERWARAPRAWPRARTSVVARGRACRQLLLFCRFVCLFVSTLACASLTLAALTCMSRTTAKHVHYPTDTCNTTVIVRRERLARLTRMISFLRTCVALNPKP
jgi:hypothetical protein